MNKQEAIEKLEYLKRLLEQGSKDSYNNGFINGLKYTLDVVKELKEPEKPVVPQFVADFYESIKDDFEDKLYELCLQFNNDSDDLPGEIWWWFDCGKNEPIQTLVKMKIYGYEVEKEKRYTVEIPSPNEQLGNHYVLYRNMAGKVIIQSFPDTHWETFSDCQLTETEIKKDFDWAWQFAEEVNDND
jgi:hypothetical protein